MTRLFVAAGGGGDALAAAIIHGATARDEGSVVATYAWERLAVDPLPGPRGLGDFERTKPLGAHNAVITAESAPVAPAGSSLPRLAGELDGRLALLDPRDGARGMAAQLDELAKLTGCDTIEVVDVGGDILAHGDELGLRSPLADALALAVCTRLDAPCELLVAGPGLDGELGEAEVLARVPPEPALKLTAEHVAAYASVLEWHPTEATGMLAAAARGARGVVELRDEGLQVALTDRSPEVYRAEWDTAIEASRLVPLLAEASSLDEAEELTRRVVGFSELDYERLKASQFGQHADTPADLSHVHRRVTEFEAEARSRGVDYVTFRRLAEALGLSPTDADQLRAELIHARPEQYEPPLWSVRAPEAG